MIGKKLEINSDFDGIAEVVGLFPKGQNDYAENHYQILINGLRLIIPASLVDTMFKEVAPYVALEEEIVEVEEPKKEIVEPKKTIKKITKKKTAKI